MELTWSLVTDSIVFNNKLTVSFHRTLRVPDDGRVYPLPPTFGKFQLHPASSVSGTQTQQWRDEKALLLPMYQSEALWIAFESTSQQAIQIEVGGINAVSGEPSEAPLSLDPQNYLVAPPQLWLDGVNAGRNIVRQFTARPLGQGHTVGEALSGSTADRESLVVRVFQPYHEVHSSTDDKNESTLLKETESLGLSAEGTLQQQIFPDPRGLNFWDQSSASEARIYLVPVALWTSTTGRKAPPRVIDAQAYSKAGLPWFSYYDESLGDVQAPDNLSDLPQAVGDEPSVKIDPSQIHDISKDKGK